MEARAIVPPLPPGTTAKVPLAGGNPCGPGRLFKGMASLHRIAVPPAGLPPGPSPASVQTDRHPSLRAAPAAPSIALALSLCSCTRMISLSFPGRSRTRDDQVVQLTEVILHPLGPGWRASPQRVAPLGSPLLQEQVPAWRRARREGKPGEPRPGGEGGGQGAAQRARQRERREAAQRARQRRRTQERPDRAEQGPRGPRRAQARKRRGESNMGRGPRADLGCGA